VSIAEDIWAHEAFTEAAAAPDYPSKAPRPRAATRPVVAGQQFIIVLTPQPLLR